VSYAAGFFGGLSERSAETRRQSAAEQERLAGLETNLLMQLAQGDDDELAALAGAGLLESITGGSKITRAKGLQGFLGQASRSSYLPGIQSVLQTRRAAGASQPPTAMAPGGAALPAGSPVEPKMQGGRGPVPEMPLVSRQGLGVAPMDAVSQAGLGLGQGGAPAASGPGGATAAAGGPPGPPPALAALGGAPPLPQGPELPTERRVRLFPSAGEVAAQQARQKIAAEYSAIFEALRSAQTPLEQRVVLGKAGTPMPTMKPSAVQLEYIDQNGMQRQGVGVLGEDGTVSVDGVEVAPVGGSVRPLQQQARWQKVRRANPDGTYDEILVNPSTGEERDMDSNMPIPQPPAFAGPLIPQGDGTLAVMPREGGTPKVVGKQNPPKTGGRTPAPTTTEAARQAKAWRALVDQEAGALKGARDPQTGERRDAATTAERDAATARVSGGAYKTYQALLMATQGIGAVPAGGPPAAARTPGTPPAFGSPEGAAAIDAALAARAGRRPQ